MPCLKIFTFSVMLIVCISPSIFPEGKDESTSLLNGSGFGFTIGFRFHYPEEVNELIDEIWEEMQEDVMVISKTGSQFMFLGIPIKVKGIIHIGPFFYMEPYGQFMWCGKILKITGDVSRNVNVNILDVTGGCNFWFKLMPKKRTSLKLGVGGFGGQTILKVSGEYGNIDMKGPAYGGNALIGLDVIFDKISINIDGIVPIGISDFKERTGKLEYDYAEAPSYPSKYSHTGFEIRPGISFRF